MFKQSTTIIAGLTLFTICTSLHSMGKTIESPNKKFVVTVVDEQYACSLDSSGKEWVMIALTNKKTKKTLFQRKLMGGNLGYLTKFDKNNKWFYARENNTVNLVDLTTEKVFNIVVETRTNKFEFGPDSRYAFAATKYAQGKIGENSYGPRKTMVRLINLLKKHYVCFDCSREAKGTFSPDGKSFQVKDGEKSYSHKLGKEVVGFTSDLKEIS